VVLPDPMLTAHRKRMICGFLEAAASSPRGQTIRTCFNRAPYWSTQPGSAASPPNRAGGAASEVCAGDQHEDGDRIAVLDQRGLPKDMTCYLFERSPSHRVSPFGPTLYGWRVQRSTASRRRTGPEGKRDEVVQFAQVEWLVQITDGSRDQRVDLCSGV
jgi:hypothetical protein